jgi:hypothetical protein
MRGGRVVQGVLASARRVLASARRIRFHRYHQTRNDTSEDRYPELFSVVARLLLQEGRASGPVLSYGCSTGDECFALRKYLPTARIVGTDISKRNLLECIKRNSDTAIRFLPPTKRLLMDQGPYEAIFAMSVLCRWPDTQLVNDCSRIYPFGRFIETVALLDDLLIPGGLLVLYNANFRFTDTSVAQHFESIAAPEGVDHGFVHLFSATNRKLEDQSYAHVVFKKLTVGNKVGG